MKNDVNNLKLELIGYRGIHLFGGSLGLNPFQVCNNVV